MSKPVLFGHPVSPYVRKTRLVLAFLGIDHEFRVTAPHSDDTEFRAASPLGKIPAFRDDDAAFADSTVIFHYLVRYYDARQLLPDAPAAFARTLWFEEYADTMLVPVIGGHLFAEVILARPLFKREPIQGDIDKAVKTELPGIYEFLDAQIGGGPWLTGDQLSVGDVAVGGMMVGLYHCGQEVPDTAPHLRGFIDRFFALDPVRSLIGEEVSLLSQMGHESPLGQLA